MKTIQVNISCHTQAINVLQNIKNLKYAISTYIAMTIIQTINPDVPSVPLLICHTSGLKTANIIEINYGEKSQLHKITIREDKHQLIIYLC